MRQLTVAAIGLVAVIVTSCVRERDRWELTIDEPGGFGLFQAAARCDDTVFLGDMESRIRPVDISTGRQLPIVRAEGPVLALSADCGRNLLYAVLPQARGRAGLTVVAIEYLSGKVVRRYAVPNTIANGAHFRPPDSLYVGGIFHPDGPEGPWNTSAESFYDGFWIGLRLSLTTEATELIVPAYEPECLGAGACLQVALAATDNGFVAAQPTSTRVALYDSSRVLTRLIDIRSPEFQRDGRSLAPRTPAPERVQWNAANSTITGVFPFAAHLATVHHRPEIGPDWTTGQPVHFIVLMNIHAYDGTLVRADVELPDLPIGQDDRGVFVVDYREHGRGSGARIVTLLRVRVP